MVISYGLKRVTIELSIKTQLEIGSRDGYFAYNTYHVGLQAFGACLEEV
jgi:hypothetical protein